MLQESNFKRQWNRGKLSRKMKKRMGKEIGFSIIPSEFTYIRNFQYTGLCAGYAGMLFSRSVSKAFRPLLESVHNLVSWFFIQEDNKSLQPTSERG